MYNVRGMSWLPMFDPISDVLFKWYEKVGSKVFFGIISETKCKFIQYKTLVMQRVASSIPDYECILYTL